MDRLDALGAPALREALLFVRGRPDPPTAADVAAALGIPRSVARWRLERLVEAGWLVPLFVQRSGRTGPGAGRPAKTYAAAAERATIEFPRRRYEQLVHLLVDALPRRGRAARLDNIGVAFGRELSRAARLRPAVRVETALDRMCLALGTLGFHASVESASPGGAVIVTTTCPLRPLVLEEQAAREIDQGMWRGLISHALERAKAADIGCATHDCFMRDAACRVVIVFDQGAND